MNHEPSAVQRASFPPDYGARGGEGDEPLAWREVEQRLRDSPNYWLVTVGASGRPHARPVDGVWVDGTLCFGGSPETRWARNLQQNPEVSVHLPSGDDVVIVEGTAAYVTEPGHPLAGATMEANRAKYPQYFSGDDGPPSLPFWAVRPRAAYAWTLAGFPKRATRWTFGE